MPSEVIHLSGLGIDMSPRFVESHTVAASPAAGSETTICTLTIPANAAQATGIQLEGWAAFTIGTNGVSATLKIRQTNTSGTTIASTGACTAVATNLVEASVRGLDTAGVLPGQVYVLTLTVGSGSAQSAVSACQLVATII